MERNIKNTTMKNIKFIIYLIIISSITSCTKQNQVVVYTSVDQVFSEPILKDFEKETGIKVKAVFDTEETKSTGVLNRIIAEKNNPQCDVFWSGDPLRTNVLKEKNITIAFDAKNAKDIPDVYKDPDKHWVGFSARARVLIYNTDSLKPNETPQSILELTNPKYKSKICIANPLFGTTTFHIAALFATLGNKKARNFMSQLKQNNIIIASSNGDVKEKVASGKAIIGLTDTDDAFEAQKNGEHIGIIFPDQKTNIGTLVMPNTVNMIKNSPNPGNAKKLIEYLLSKKTEKKLAKSCAQMPLHKSIKIDINIPSLDTIKPMKINYKETAVKLQEIQKYLKSWTEN